MAHVLGIIATKMDGSGAWIAAASLNHYLLTTGKPQIFGLGLDNVSPFNPDLLTDRIRAAVCVPGIGSRAKLLAAIANDPNNALPDNPCLDETTKALAGKWLLTRKDRNGKITQLTLDCKLDANGDPIVQLSGPGIPPHPKIEADSGGNNLKIRVHGETFDLAMKGDIITGHYYSASSSGAIVGLR